MELNCVNPNCQFSRDIFEAYCGEDCKSKDTNQIWATDQGLFFANGQYGPPWTAGLSFTSQSSSEVPDHFSVSNSPVIAPIKATNSLTKDYKIVTSKRDEKSPPNKVYFDDLESIEEVKQSRLFSSSFY
jgi:hypothetical protein